MSDNVNNRLLEVLEIGLQHEQQHQELLYYDIKYILGNNPLFPVYLSNKKNDTPSTAAQLGFLTVDEGIYTIGHGNNDFCFDNEKGVHQVFLHAYSVSDRLTTNGEYLEFMQDGGYKDFSLWLSEGWEWNKNEQIKAPLYWHLINNVWHQYTMFGLLPVDLNQPISHTNYYEASAFAKWKGMRLPTEFEWEVACKNHQPSIPLSANLSDLDNFGPVQPMDNNYQFYGDLWEWTSSSYLPYPYYATPEGALGEYNGKFMINQMVLRGGSFATPSDHIRSTYRNFFHPHLRWHFTGIRLAQYV